MSRDGVQWLSDYAGGKVVIECTCGLRRRYDANKMIARIGDRDMPGLLLDLATAEGCEKKKNIEPPASRRECQVVYDIHAMGMFSK
jgi:hypothetical protein